MFNERSEIVPQIMKKFPKVVVSTKKNVRNSQKGRLQKGSYQRFKQLNGILV